MSESLAKEYEILFEYNTISSEIPSHISSNLNPRMKLRPYQNKALAFLRFHNQESKNSDQRHLLYHMATGSGKTLIMAGAILDLYKMGYRHFVFFVQSTNIIKKTKDNFLKQNHNKYLFNKTISIEGKNIQINEVSDFSYMNNTNDINILFTTIQGLHSNIKNPSENSMTLTSFEDQRVVLIADEAHHINVDTRETQRDKKNRISWESTVDKIFQANSENFLLEFTATAELEHPEIEKKYNDKLIYDYPLKKFREDKYSKEVKLFQADLEPFKRSLISVILSQYRRKVFEKNGLNIKPVILFKSKTIAESEGFYEEFCKKIQNIDSKMLKNVMQSDESLNKSDNIFKKIGNFFKKNNITLENLALEIKEDFKSNKCISVNSKDDSEEKQRIVNNLEDTNNQYRVVFAVDKLNEGWDVLNLFDIVRLYNTRDADHKTGRIGNTTMQEAQLIGRGARYCPFKIEEHHDTFKRKYDDDTEAELRICEELYYHAAHNPRYISELNKALTKTGIKPSKEAHKILKLKEEFKKTDFYRKGKIFTNKRIKNTREEVSDLSKDIRKKIYKKALSSGQTSSTIAFDNSDTNSSLIRTEKQFNLNDFDKHIIRKSLDKLPFLGLIILRNFFLNWSLLKSLLLLIII